MSAVLQALLAQAATDAAEGRDLNVADKGGSGGRLLPEGYAFGRLVEYTEYGNQPQEFQGKAKDPALEFSLGFALTGQGYQNDDGTAYVVRTYAMAMSLFEKSGAFKLFKALNWTGNAAITSFAMLLGQPFLVKIKNVPKSKADPTIVSRIDLAGFLPPLDPVSKQPYTIADAPDELYRLFLWRNPTKAAWDSLFIEGDNNFIQETILGALDFQGSPLQLLLSGGVASLPVTVPPLASPAVAAQAVSPAPVVGVTVPNVTASAAVAVPVAAPAVAAAPVVATPQVVVPQVQAAPVVSTPVLPA